MRIDGSMPTLETSRRADAYRGFVQRVAGLGREGVRQAIWGMAEPRLMMPRET